MDLAQLDQYTTQRSFPEEFWYATTVILALALIWILQRYVSRIDKMLHDLSDRTRSNESRLDITENDIEHIKEKVFPVKYRK